ncbi:hypothetical protein PITC_063210 [Penicillium italicum]|uniref:Uncharacterized protein n=1 Tax=Penicillium italicum TaxID=40296 RepID=A0A0A2L3P8_PENIT|nr:hypothetical protein PITC_063210 [Penicillium italicum]
MADDILILRSISYTSPGRHPNRHDAYFLFGKDIQTRGLHGQLYLKSHGAINLFKRAGLR